MTFEAFEDYQMETLLLNLFFIMFPLIFYQVILNDRISNKPIIRNVLYFLIFIVPIWLCMIFSVSNMNGFFINFHSTPFIMACLYSNPAVSILIYICMLSVRIMLGGDGQYMMMVSDTAALITVLVLVKTYRTMRLRQKILLAFFINIGSKVLAKIVFVVFDPAYVLKFHLTFYLIEGFFMTLCLYTIEAILKNMQLKKELIDSEKIKVASVISASVAHEIRNPLTSVRGFIQLLYESPELTYEKRQMYGKICLEELDRAQQIINDYLSLARPYPEAIETIDIGEEIKYVSTVLTSYANLKGVEMQAEMESGLLVSGDRQKLRQSIINIGKNGIEAMEQGGVLSLKARRRGKDVMLHISDSGSGMTNEQVNRLGTPYFSTKDKGTGLGTLVSFNIIKNMLGKIKIESKVGVGTSFHISFPAAGECSLSE